MAACRKISIPLPDARVRNWPLLSAPGRFRPQPNYAVSEFDRISRNIARIFFPNLRPSFVKVRANFFIFFDLRSSLDHANDSCARCCSGRATSRPCGKRPTKRQILVHCSHVNSRKSNSLSRRETDGSVRPPFFLLPSSLLPLAPSSLTVALSEYGRRFRADEKPICANKPARSVSEAATCGISLAYASGWCETRQR